jgi:pectate lyase
MVQHDVGYDMRGKYRPHHILEVVLLFIALAGFSASNSKAEESSKYLDAVREFADNVLKYGRDTYGPKHTPLFVDGLNIHNHEPVKWIAPNGERWILSNLASQQNLFRTLVGLSTITGDPKYKQAAMDAIKYAFANLRSPNGLLYWGRQTAYDAKADKAPIGGRPHKLTENYPYYDLMWEVDSGATRDFIESLWSAHIIDWSNLDMDRLARFDQSLEEPWEHEYTGGPVFFKSKVSWATSFIYTGSDLSYAAAILYKLSSQKEPLIWAKRLSRRYVETRNPKTGISAITYNFKYPPYQLIEDFGRHFNDPRTTIFPVRSFVSPLRSLPPKLAIRPWICNFLLGEMLNEEGKEFQQWALEELSAWGKSSYRKEDNAWVPILTDGTCIEGYVCKKDGDLCPKGGVAKVVPADSLSLWAYSLAYQKTNDDFMWQMVRDIASGNGFGEIGKHPKDESRLKTCTSCSDPYALLAFLELHRKTHKGIFLDMARRLGDNILSDRFHKAFFVRSKKHMYARFDNLEPLALLHLEATRRGRPISLPVVWPSWALFDSYYAGRGVRRDVYLIYSLTEPPDPPKSLHDAAASGDVQELKALISRGVDVNIRERDVSAPLHRAAQHGHVQFVEILLAEGADIDAGDYTGATPLYYAVEKGYKDVAELLLANGVDVNARNAAGDTPLHYAARSRNAGRDVIELLIARGANVNAKNKDGQTPTDIALSRNRYEVVRLLIAKGADVEVSLHAAARIGSLVKVKNLIEKGADINAKDTAGQTPLHHAVGYGRKDAVELLIANGANMHVKDKDGNVPVVIALRENYSAILDLLIAKGANFDPIHLFAYQGDLDKVMSFIEKGTGVNAMDSYGATPLYYAAMRGNKKDKSGYGPVHLAALEGHRDVVQVLIANGADLDSQNGGVLTPLCWAARKGHRDVVELLISRGADVNAKDRRGRTPLRWAEYRGHTEIVELLRKHGAKE